MDERSLYIMSPLEIAWGYLLGTVTSTDHLADRSATPREALERTILRALRRPPCGVAFSGGRDSSAVLAIAAHVARREGLRTPIPITRVFPNAPASEEGVWQESVIRHLRLDDWLRLPIDDELDLVGPRARIHLLEHGVAWPPMLHADGPLLDQVRGGSLIDGEGGDEVLGVDAHRIAPVTSLVRSPRPIRRGRYRPVVRAFAPARVRERALRRSWSERPLTWLRPAAREQLLDAVCRFEAERPLAYHASVATVPLRRSQALMAHNRRVVGRRADVAISSPLLDADVVAALGHAGGRLGVGGRTAVLRRLVPDLLPDAVLARTTKATFGEAYMGRHTVDFARTWGGDGVDTELVDPVELRRLWLSDERIGLTAAALQAAWLASGDHRSHERTA